MSVTIPELGQVEQTEKQIAAFQFKLELIREAADVRPQVEQMNARLSEIDTFVQDIDAGKYDNIPTRTNERTSGENNGGGNGQQARETQQLSVNKGGRKSKDKVGGNKGGGNKGGKNKGVRARNEQPLRELVSDILKRNRSGLQLAEVVEKVREAGYKSNTTKDFANIVYQTLYKLKNDTKSVIKDKDTKKYKLAA